MYEILVKLIFAAALVELGLSIKDAGDCSSPACLGRLQRASHKVLHVDWKPISVFPEEAARFKKPAR